MRFFSLIAVVLLVSSLAPPARAGMKEDCEQERDWSLKIGGCTAAIGSGQWQGKELAPVYSNRGNAYFNLGEYRRAIQDYDQALRLDPGYAVAYYNRGKAYTELRVHRRAIQDYDQTLRINPGLAIAYYNRGIAYNGLGEHHRAIQDYDQALRIDPGYADAYHNRGWSYKIFADYDRAARDWEKAIRFGGAPRAKWWQKHLKGKGYYAGAVDGIFGPGTRRGLLACARDPNC